VIYRLNQYGCTVHALNMRWIILIFHFAKPIPTGRTRQIMPTPVQGRRLPPRATLPQSIPQMGGRGWVGLIYDLDEKERRLKLEMGCVSVRAGCVMRVEVRVEGL
jgi:hypothetical protein